METDGLEAAVDSGGGAWKDTIKPEGSRDNHGRFFHDSVSFTHFLGNTFVKNTWDSIQDKRLWK